jgi:hypothetical protein
MSGYDRLGRVTSGYVMLNTVKWQLVTQLLTDQNTQGAKIPI